MRSEVAEHRVVLKSLRMTKLLIMPRYSVLRAQVLLLHGTMQPADEVPKPPQPHSAKADKTCWAVISRYTFGWEEGAGGRSWRRWTRDPSSSTLPSNWGGRGWSRQRLFAPARVHQTDQTEQFRPRLSQGRTWTLGDVTNLLSPLQPPYHDCHTFA